MRSMIVMALAVVLAVASGCEASALLTRTASASLSQDATPSQRIGPTGRIAFEVEAGFDGADSKNIVTVSPDGSDRLHVTNLERGYAYHPAFTADGLHLVFAMEDEAPSRWSGTSSHLYVTGRDGSQPRQVTAGRQYDTAPAPSPDGEMVAFVRQIGHDRSAIFLANRDGTSVRQLTRPPAPESDNFPNFSPDGTRLAFDRGSAIYTMPADGSAEPMRVTPSGLDAQYPRWSPDGGRILFEADGIHVINADGSGERYLGSGGTGDWSPDGGWIGYSRYTEGTNYIALVVARADGSDDTEIWTTPPGTDTFIVYVDWGAGP